MENGKHVPKDLKQAYRTSYLLAGYIKKTLTADEQQELDAWVQESDHNLQLFMELTDKKNVEKAMKYFQKRDTEENLQKSKAGKEFNSTPKIIRLRPFLLVAVSLLAIVLLIWFFRSPSGSEQQKQLVRAAEEILPGSGHAVLTLADGKQVILNRDGKDTTISPDVSVIGKDKELVYTGAGQEEYHTLSIPAGGGYTLKLADGSVVYLNAESSIRYPTVFNGNTRKVEVTGEAFFEVAHDPKKQFIVQAGQMLVEDIGTSFNVNSYSNEPSINTTLIEGSVRISSDEEGKSILIKPGEQAILEGSLLKINSQIDTASVIAWKNDQFRFVNTPLPKIMREIERWYDAKIVYQDNITVHLNATIQRNVPLSKLLYLLEKTNDVHFKIEGNTIIVMK